MAQVPLVYGCKIVFEAIDPATGSPVTGVIIDDPVVYGYNLSTPQDTAIQSEQPLWLPVPNNA